jgi:hypothetical protein
MKDVPRSVVLCEGFDDRAFLAGWLLFLGCTDPGNQGSGLRKKVFDPNGTEVSVGHHAWNSKSGSFVKVMPCHGDDQVLRMLDVELPRRFSERLDRVVVCLDDDGHGVEGRRAAIDQRVLKAGGPTVPDRSGDWILDGGTVVSAVIWQCDDANSPGIPAKQTLERLVCAALCGAHGLRGGAVDAWLHGRPAPAPDADHKAFCWSHMAGWYADHGCASFFQEVWREAAVRSELEHRLRSAGAWQVVSTLAE